MIEYKFREDLKRSLGPFLLSSLFTIKCHPPPHTNILFHNAILISCGFYDYKLQILWIKTWKQTRCITSELRFLYQVRSLMETSQGELHMLLSSLFSVESSTIAEMFTDFFQQGF